MCIAVVLLAVLGVAVSTSCLDPVGTTCSIASTCPPGKACDDIHGKCVESDQLESGEGEVDETECLAGDPIDGLYYAARR